MSAPKETTRSFLDILLEGTAEFESPERYYWWSGIAAIAAVVKKNVYLDRGGSYTLYPNIFVALISKESSTTRKGPPITTCKGLLEELGNVRILSGNNSIQGIIHDLSMQKTFPSGVVLNEAQGIMISEEFDAFLNDDPKALSLLTTLYSTHEHGGGYTKTLKNSPVEVLRSPCLSLLVASNEALFESMVKQKDVIGGFIARTLLVHEVETTKINPLTRPPKVKLDRQALIDRLRVISKIRGEFKWTDEAEDFYINWYHKLRRSKINDRTGSIGRIQDHVLKVAMLVSLARKEDLDLAVEDLALAIAKCEECMQAIQIANMGGSQLDAGPGESLRLVLRALLDAPNGTLSRKEILKMFRHKGVDSFMLDRVVETLVQSKSIEQFKSSKNEFSYRATKEELAKWSQFKREEGG